MRTADWITLVIFVTACAVFGICGYEVGFNYGSDGCELIAEVIPM